MSRLVFFVALIVLTLGVSFGADNGAADVSKASWIWTGPKPVAVGEWECYARRTFELGQMPKRATVLVTGDNVYELFVNGKFIGEDGGYDTVFWKSLELYDITKLLVDGKNTVGARGKSLGGSAGLVVAVRIEESDGKVVELYSGKDWRVSQIYADNWATAAYDDSAWKEPFVVAAVGGAPWGEMVYPGPVSPMTLNRVSMMEVGADFEWPAGAVFIRDFVPLKEPEDFTVYVMGSRAYFEHDAPTPAALGRQLYSVVPASPDGKVTMLLDAGKGLIGSPTVSYDGRRIYFSMVTEGDTFFHIYEISPEGTGLKAVTEGPFHDYDPAELPDGRIIFSSTRLGTRDEYHGNLASSLFAVNPDGTNIEPVTYHIVADREPEVTADGSVAMIRCDNFFERAKVETRIQQVRPDGTGGMVVLGANRGAIGFDPAYAAERNSAWLRQNGYGSPAALADGRIAAISNHGLVASGLLDAGGSGLEKSGGGYVPYDVSPLPDGRLLCTGMGRSWMGVLDYSTGKIAKIMSMDQMHSVTYLGERPKPRVIASHINQIDARRVDKTGFLLCQSVFGTRQSNADLDRIKAVRIIEGRPFTLRSAKHRFVHLGVEAIELGTVPLAPDGSFYVEVPADRALAIQAVDAEGRGVINETTWIYVRPGEQLSCVGCHNKRTLAPTKNVNPLAAKFGPVALLGKGDPHRYRANNAGNGGMLNLQFDRFREAGGINLYSNDVADNSLEMDVKKLCGIIDSGKDDQKVSALQKLAVLRDRRAVGTIKKALKSPSVEVRRNAALALSACGNREAIGVLLDALRDKSPFVAQAANVALENLVCHSIDFNAFDRDGVEDQAKQWQSWFADNDWPAIETKLIAKLSHNDSVKVYKSIEALGHTGGTQGAVALREYLTKGKDDNLRIRMAAMRSLGNLKDEGSVAALVKIMNDNMLKDPGNPIDLHELGWQQRPVYLAATAAEALGQIGTPECEKALVDAFPKLRVFWDYTLWTGDHSWLMGCHSSVLHYRIIEAFDAMETTLPQACVVTALKSVPIDTDRALLYENDTYENLTARVVGRCGHVDSVLEACLAVLGDTEFKADGSLNTAVTASPPALSVLPQDPESRAAQIACVVAMDKKYAARFRAAFDRYRAKEPSRTRSWVCFFLARLLGQIADEGSVDSLIAALEDDATEASFGFESQPHVFVYKAMTPFYRAAAADALGRIGNARAADTLVDIVRDFDNAISVRHEAARAIGRIGDSKAITRLKMLAADYPEVSVRRAMLEAAQ